jgi:hypothetical protein
MDQPTRLKMLEPDRGHWDRRPAWIREDCARRLLLPCGAFIQIVDDQ